jgi:hypothetical protein
MLGWRPTRFPCPLLYIINTSKFRDLHFSDLGFADRTAER